MNIIRVGLLTLCLLQALSVSAAEERNPDPLEGLNRVTHGFNEVVDRWLLKPAARGYQWLVPDDVQQVVGNFFSNLGDIDNAVNNVLQGKVAAGASDVGRVLINSSLGLGGLFDPATGFGLERHDEDFGQTLRHWGLPPGPYLVMPLLGPSTLTDTLGRPFDSQLDPLRYYYPVDHRNRLYLTQLLDTRAGLLAAEGMVFGERYVFFREAYLQRREFLAKDGQVADDFDDF